MESALPTTAPIALVLVAAAGLGLVACFNAGIPVRPGELPSDGQPGVHLQFSVVTYAPGQATLSDGQVVEGNSGRRAVLDPMTFILLPFINSIVSLDLGLTDRLALGLVLGGQQLGGEVRVAILDETAGQAVSLALSGQGAYRPFIEAKSPWLTLGFDVSHRWTPVVTFANLYASWGPEAHEFYVACGRPGVGECGEDQIPQLSVTQDELRLHLGLGLGSADRQEGVEGGVSLALVGYWVAQSAEPDRQTCVACNDLDAVAFGEDYGCSLVFSAFAAGVDR